MLQDNGSTAHHALTQSKPSFHRTLLPYFTDLCDELRFEKLTLCILPYERDWVQQYGETMFSANHIHCIVVKATFALVMLWGQWLSIFGWESDGRYYGIYLTYWTLTVQNLYHLFNLILAIQVCMNPEGQPCPFTIQTTTTLRAIAEPCALIVTALYSLGTHFEDKSLSNVMVHAVNGIVILLDAMVGRQTSRLCNNLWGFAYFGIYMLWTVIHYLMGMGDPTGNRCIYHGLCWEQPRVAVLNFLLIFVLIMPATSLLIWSLVWLRDVLISDTDRHRYLAANPAHDPWGGFRVGCQALCCLLPIGCLLCAFWMEKKCHMEAIGDWRTKGHIYACKHHGGPLESSLESLATVLKTLSTRARDGLVDLEKED